jgi:hypothetical protein
LLFCPTRSESGGKQLSLTSSFTLCRKAPRVPGACPGNRSESLSGIL